MKKKIALAACFLALALASAACGSETTDPGTDSRPSGEGSSAPASDSGTESDDPEATRYSLPEPELPELNYGGAAFVMYPGSSEDGYYHESVLFPAASYLWVEKLNGEVVNDSVFNRNLAVENKFNVKITVLDTETKPEMLVMAGEPMDLVQAQGPYLAETVDTGAWLNMIGFPYLNLEAEYWSPRCLAGTIVDDIAFFMPSDICMDPLSATGILYFNKRLLAENDMESPYDLVHENRWTIDKFMEMVKQGPRDLNGDGKMDLSDQYGALIRHQWRSGVFMQLYFGIGLTYTRVDPDQGRVLNFNGEVAQGLLDQVCEIFKDKKISMPAYEVEELGEEASYYETMFAEGRALFCQDFVSSLDIFREMDDDFGIVPNPKYDRSQEEYYQRVGPSACMFSIPATVVDEEKVGVITEYMSWLSHNTVLPAYYEITVKNKRIRDEDAVEMLDIIRTSLVFEFAEMYYTHIPHYVQDAFDFRSFPNRVLSNEKFLAKRVARYVKMIRSKAE